MDKIALDAMNVAAGRELHNDEIHAAEERVETAFHDLEAEDPTAWRALPIAERVSRAAELATTRHKAAVMAKQRRNIAKMVAQSPDVPRAPITSGAVLNGYALSEVV
jgi:hypothetical protein